MLRHFRKMLTSCFSARSGKKTRRVPLCVEALEAREVLTASPYLLPANAGVSIQAILTVGDSVNGYRMVGIPDGLGAFDNGNGTFTVLMNHELTSTAGVARAHNASLGANGHGAFVSEFIIDKATLQVYSGQDLIQNVVLNGSTLLNFDRFCSADLPALTAFFYPAGSLGTTDRILMDGEETAGGRAFGHVASGSFTGTSYELPLLGKFAHENVSANPFAQLLTVVAGTDDTTPVLTPTNNGGGKVYIYVGTKTNSGTPVDKAGLTNGTNYAIQVGSLVAETRDFGLATSGTLVTSGSFTLVNPASGGTQFMRPEDAAWDPTHPNDLYFVTTDRLDQVQDGLGSQIGRARLWRARFTDLSNPTAGGTIEMLLDGTEGGNMYDNIAVDTTGHVILQEDVGNAPHLGKVWSYDIANDRIFPLARSDAARFGDAGIAATAPFTQDEESSGVIDVSSIFGPGSYLLDVQAHYPINAANPNGFANPNELVEGGQLLLMKVTPTVSFLAVGAGDATSTSAVLWTRAQDVTSSAGVGLIAQVSTDQTFETGLATFAGVTDPAHDFTIHVDANGLEPGTRYFYRFVASDGTISQVGTFVTAPSEGANAPVSLGFTGDADGLMRPYPATSSANFTAPGTAGFGPNNFDYFVWLGDTIYETKSGDGTPNSSPTVNASPVVAEYWRKYREQFLPVSTGAYPGLQSFFDSAGHYTLLDNHELGNLQYINGGAAASAPTNTTDTSFDVNTTGTFKHDTAAYKVLQQAYNDYQPIRVETVDAPDDPRSDGTQKMYFAQQWGANNIFINVDDRTNRDIRLRKVSGSSTADDTGDRADNPGRTMLGETELEWLKDSLLAAQADGITWKIVATSSPIDQIGAIGSGIDGGKSWIGGYRPERNELLKFIDDNNIDHVVFFSTDDHILRVNELGYFTSFTTNSLGFQAPVQSSYVRIPGAMSIVAGPIGATGPDTITDHSFANIQGLANTLVAQQNAGMVDPIGLDAAFPGLKNVMREGDASADTNRTGFDFYSPDTFNYATLNISADGSTLSVGVKGINSYAVNTFPQPSGANPVRDILSFQIGLKKTTLTVAPATATYGGKATISATLKDSATSAPVAGKLITFTLDGEVVGTATTEANGVASLPNIDVSGFNAGTYTGAIEASFTGDAGTLAAAGSGNLVVNKASLVVTAFNRVKVYGQTITDLAGSVVGLKNNDPITATFSSPGAAETAPVSLSTYNINATLSDPNHRLGNYKVTINVGHLTVTYLALEPDPANPNQMALFVGGSAGNDKIDIGLGKSAGQLKVEIKTPNFHVSQIVSSNVSRLVVFGGPSKDEITVNRFVGLQAVLSGGDGNDTIRAGGGASVLLGGSGNDSLFGGFSNDILIGGLGIDDLQAGGHQDVLIGGTTVFDTHLPALIGLLKEWSRTDESYAQSVANLQNGPVSTPSGTVMPNGSYTAGFFLNSSTVHSDAAANTLRGGAELDWFFANLDGIGNFGVKDKIRNLKAGEIVTKVTL